MTAEAWKDKKRSFERFSFEAHPLIRIYHEGAFVASKGRVQLLELIDRLGSLSKAAREMKMSYRHAWGLIKKMDEAMGESVVAMTRGGAGGGKAVLTDAGRAVVEFYRWTEMGVEKAARYGPSPSLAVDGVIVSDEGDRFVAVKRRNPPFQGKYVLPGGFVEYGETVEEAVVREMREETGLETEIVDLLGVFSDPPRDPRGHTVSVAFLLRPVGGKLVGGDDASEAKWFPFGSPPALGFDHGEILERAKILVENRQIQQKTGPRSRSRE